MTRIEKVMKSEKAKEKVMKNYCPKYWGLPDDWKTCSGLRIDSECIKCWNRNAESEHKGEAAMTRLEYLRSLSIEDFAKAILEIDTIGTGDPAYCDGSCAPPEYCSTENELECCVRWLEQPVAGKQPED